MPLKAKLDVSAVRIAYPIAHELAGWFFRVEKLASSRWRASGTDLYGRRVACEGENADVLFKAVSTARQMPERDNAA